MRRARNVLSIPAAAAVTFVAVYQLAPVGGSTQADTPTAATTSTATASADTVSPATAPTADTVYYPGCNAARAAGAAPIYRGQPGYRVEMDGDLDGIACEPHRY